MIGESRRLLATPESEQFGRYFWDLVFGKSAEGELSRQNAMGGKSKRPKTNDRNFTKIGVFCSHGGIPSSSVEPASKNTNRPPKDPIENKRDRKEKYLAPAEYAERPYRKFGCDPNHVRNPDPESKRSVIKGQLKQKGKGGHKGQNGKEDNANGKGSQDTAESPQVKDLSNIQSLDNKICVPGGTNLTQLRDGLRR